LKASLNVGGREKDCNQVENLKLRNWRRKKNHGCRQVLQLKKKRRKNRYDNQKI
jgi:hypothetical protein